MEKQKSIQSENRNNNASKKPILQIIVNKILSCPNQTISKASGFIESLISKNTKNLKIFSEDGIPDEIPILRSIIWKINFGYLPINNEEWTKILEDKRSSYFYYKDIFTKKLQEEYKLYKDYNTMSKEDKEKIDKKTNKALLEQIRKDVNRTHNQMDFFFKSIDENNQLTKKELMEMMENRINCSMKNVNDIYKINIKETHADAIVRILFIYSYFFPDLSYVQGMNEIIAPIYYIFSFDKTYGVEPSIENIEADTFWTFNCLMTQVKDIFNREKDDKDIGLSGKVKRLKLMLKIVDSQLYEHFEKYKLEYSTFAYRWFILFFSQEFLMIDILRLWDYIFAQEDKFLNCYFISLAVLLLKKDELLVSDLTGMLSELRSIKGLNVEEMISISKKIKSEYGQECLTIINEIYE
jgi:hypothetical protein